jgi:hypothetical protein
MKKLPTEKNAAAYFAFQPMTNKRNVYDIGTSSSWGRPATSGSTSSSDEAKRRSDDRRRSGSMWSGSDDEVNVGESRSSKTPRGSFSQNDAVEESQEVSADSAERRKRNSDAAEQCFKKRRTSSSDIDSDDVSDAGRRKSEEVQVGIFRY